MELKSGNEVWLVTYRTNLRYRTQIICEVWHQVSPGCRGNSHADSAEVGPAVGRHQRVSDPPDHPGESDEGLRVLPISQVAVAAEDGRLYVAGGGVKEGLTCEMEGGWRCG